LKFKLDESLGTSIRQLVGSAGHDVMTVAQENLVGCADRQLYDRCCEEGRALITLDLDFGDVTRFPPQRAGGIIVLRPARSYRLPELISLTQQALKAAAAASPVRQLWVVEPGRIRVHQSDAD
jgi:predicted nuclease of predicted toxin-antitoxin system